MKDAIKSDAVSDQEGRIGDGIPEAVGMHVDDRSMERRTENLHPTGSSADLSIVVPTFNEKENVEPLVRALRHVLNDTAWEVIFVDDDSPDGTADAIRNLASKYTNVRCIQRIGRRGLSSACVEGMLASSAPYLAVMDADMQHDMTVLPLMLEKLKREQLEIVIGSRYIDGGGTGDWARSRIQLSGFATRIARMTMRTSLRDPMSGFFLLRRSLLERTVRRMTGKGFKILLDLFLSADAPIRFAEFPYEMRSRIHGESKLDLFVAWEYLVLLLDKLVGRFIPVRFIAFVTVGVGGAVLHIAVLGTAIQLLQQPFIVGQSLATLIAMTANFFFNNLLTYHDRQLRGWGAFRGLISFYIACGLGAFINVVVAGFLFESGIPWWFSGLLGALVGAVWNFAITSSFTWRSDDGRPTYGKNSAE